MNNNNNNLIINKYIGYARVSADDQDLIRQIKILNDNGVRNDDIYKDYVTGKTKERAELNKCLAALHKGDTFVVVDLDRLSRDTIHGLEIITEIASKGCYFKSINEGVFNISSEDDEFKLTLYFALAKLERSKLKRRQREAWEAGKIKGRPKEYKVLSNGEIELLDKNKNTKLLSCIELYNKGFTINEICKTLDISQHTLYKWLKYKKIKTQRCFNKVKNIKK